MTLWITIIVLIAGVAVVFFRMDKLDPNQQKQGKSSDSESNKNSSTTSPPKIDEPKKPSSSPWDYIGKGLLILIIGLLALSLIQTVGGWVNEHEKYTHRDPNVTESERQTITDTLHLTKEWTGWIVPLSLVHEVGKFQVDMDIIHECSFALMDADGKVTTYIRSGKVPMDRTLNLHRFRIKTLDCDNADMVLKLTPM